MSNPGDSSQPPMTDDEMLGGRPVLLDAFCGAGGATRGYQEAGFYVVGVDNRPQPNYCGDEFVQADALEYLEWLVSSGRALALYGIHASPPCQAYSRTAQLHPERNYPKLIEPTRRLLGATGLPWVIENVPGAPLRPDYDLCGTTFGLRTRRHRWFEVSWGPVAHLHAPCVNHTEAPVQVFGHGGDSSRYWTMDEWREAMGIDWMTRDEMAEAIPPVYGEFIGRRLIETIRAHA